MTPLTPAGMEDCALMIEEGESDHDAMKEFHYLLLSSTRPEPSEDAQCSERNNYSNFIQNLDPRACHPRVYDTQNTLEVSPSKKRKQALQND